MPGNPPISDEQFAGLHQKLVNQGGYTANARTLYEPPTGWMVGRAGTEATFDMPGSGADIREHYVQYRPQIERAGHMGGWENEGQGVLNATRRYNNTTEGFLRAGKSMRHQGEQSIYEPGSEQLYWNSQRWAKDEGKRPIDFTDTPEYQGNQKIHQKWAKQRLQEKFGRTIG